MKRGGRIHRVVQAICLIAAATCPTWIFAEPTGDASEFEREIGEPNEKRKNLLFDIREGRLRLELETDFGIESGSIVRTDEAAVKGTIEYEVPLVKHLTVSGRAMPLFYYHEDVDNGDHEHVAAFGLGPVFRVYTKGDEFRGFYFEIGISAIIQTNKFEGNSTLFNFMSEGGVGYMFPRDIHISATVQHISNAGFGDENAGVNMVGIGAGFAFKPGQFRERQASRMDEK